MRVRCMVSTTYATVIQVARGWVVTEGTASVLPCLVVDDVLRDIRSMLKLLCNSFKRTTTCNYKNLLHVAQVTSPGKVVSEAVVLCCIRADHRYTCI